MTEQLALRAPEPSDVDTLYIWENDPGLFESLPNAAPLSRMQVWEYVQGYTADPFVSRELRLMIVDAAADAVGYIDMFDFDPVNRRAGVAIYIKECCRSKGYGSEALSLFEKYVCSTLGMHMLWAYVSVDNEPSKALFGKNGFKSAGKLRSWLRRGNQYCDVIIYQKLFI